MRIGAPCDGVPEVWLLGSGVDSAMLAANRGLPFSFTHFFGNSSQGPAITEYYRSHFQPSARYPEPRVHVAVQVLCADTKEEADWHASSMKLGRIQMARNQGGSGIVSPEEAAQHVFTPEEEAFLVHSGMRATVGDPASVAAELEAIAERYGADELGIVTICYDFKARLRSFELVARQLLGPPSGT